MSRALGHSPITRSCNKRAHICFNATAVQFPRQTLRELLAKGETLITGHIDVHLPICSPTMIETIVIEQYEDCSKGLENTSQVVTVMDMEEIR